MITVITLWLRRYRLHFLLWALYIMYEYALVAMAFGEYGNPMVYFIHYVIILSYFYLHAHLLFKWALNHTYSVTWRVPLLILLELCSYVLICFVADKGLEKWHFLIRPTPLAFDKIYILKNLYRGIYFVGFSTGYYFLITYSKERRQREESEKQRLTAIIQRQKAEQELTMANNAFLKAQINPHFLFNTLDFIYHHIMEVSPVAADAIISLSEMMRFAIDADKRGEYIAIGEELEQVVNLQYLNQIRKNETVVFHLSYDDGVSDLSFIPLVLLTLTENIFKHGDLSRGQTASLKVYTSQSVLYIESSNASSRTKSGLTTGDGLANIQKRLTYAYGAAADFDYV